MMEYIKNIGIIFLIFSLNSCLAQNKLKNISDYDILLINQLIEEDSLFLQIDTFMRNADESIGSNVLGSPNNYDLAVYNLISNKKYDINVSHGLFMFLQPSSHPFYYLYLKNKDGTINILDYDGESEIDSLTNELSNYFKRNEIKSKETKLKYLFGVVKFLNSKYTYPVSIKCLPNDWECEN